jgi:D-alanine-D-alanine ligase
MTGKSLLLLFGVDANTLAVDAECTYETMPRAAAALRSRGWRVELCEVTHTLESALAPYSPSDWLVFNLCEGSPGQESYYARAAQLLEAKGYGYTGCDSVVLEETQYKPRMKRLLQAGNVPTPRWCAVTRADDLDFNTFPAIVKPAAEHCSFGITRESVVFSLDQAKKQVNSLLRQYPAGAIVEEFLDGDEYAVSLWGEKRIPEVIAISVISYDALPDMRDRVCTFDAKWLPQTEVYQKTMPICPAPLGKTRCTQIERLARAAYRACRLRDYGRVDLRLRNGRPMVLDVNANCALSENGGFVDSACIMGWDYGSVLDRLVRMAATRRPSESSQRPDLEGALSRGVNNVRNWKRKIMFAQTQGTAAEDPAMP